MLTKCINFAAEIKHNVICMLVFEDNRRNLTFERATKAESLFLAE